MVDIVVEDLTFAYPDAARNALEHVSLELGFGAYVCVCGPSGCGKTTLLRHLKSVLAPYGTRSGVVLVNSEPIDDMDEHTQSALIGFVMQDPDAQIVTDKVWHELAFGLECLGVDRKTMRLRVAEMASYFGIQDWIDRDVSELSGGQKQLLNLASVMAMQPSVLVLDEPTSQLDPIASSDFLNTIRRINLELGTTIVITEHRLEGVFATADEVVVMEEGRIVAQGSPREVAAELHRANSVMTRALPAPARVFYGVEPALAADVACPLTVREGRAWLTDLVISRPPRRTALPPEDEPANAPVALELKDLWFRYGRDSADVLKGLTLAVPRATLAAVVGGNGSGKSTMLKCACGVLAPYRGSVRVLGRKRSRRRGADATRDAVAMLPQDPSNLFVEGSVRRDLEEMLRGRELDAVEVEERLQEVARLCDVADVFERHPLDLSGGELQRAALAKVLLAEPEVLLLDEPTKGVDCLRKDELAELFARLKGQGMTIVMVSHDIEFCARVADQVSMLFDGSIVTTNAPRAFFSQNGFYTTAANRMSRNVFANAVTVADVIELCATMPAPDSQAGQDAF